MQKPLTSKQHSEIEKLKSAIAKAEQALVDVEREFGTKSPYYAVAERQRDEISARMRRATGTLVEVREPKSPSNDRASPIVIRTKRVIRRTNMQSVRG